MGMFSVDMELSALEGRGALMVKATVDSGATFSMAPRSMLEQAGFSATDMVRLEMGDGSIIDLPACYAWITVGEHSGISIVVFGEENGPRVLGVVALETMLLAIDPVGRRLVPTNAIHL